LTLSGSGFVLGATVQWTENGSTTTLGPFSISSTQLQLIVPASLVRRGLAGKVLVSVSQPFGQSTVTSNEVTFTITPISGVGPGGVTLNVVEGQTFTAVVATFANGGAFAASIDWGDGTTSSGTIVSQGNGVFAVVGTHTYGEDGESEMDLVDVFPITVTIFKFGGTTLTVNSIANVSEEAGAVLTAQGGFTFNTKEFVRLTNITVATGTGTPTSATIDWGDGTSSTGTIVSNGSGGFSITGSHTYSELGGPGPDLENEMDTVDTFTMTVTISNSSTTVTVTNTVNVAEEEEILSAQGGFTFNTQEYQTLSNVVLATFTPGAMESAGEFTANIDWGDGTTSTGTVVDQGNGTFAVLGTHTYSELGGPGPDLENEMDTVDTFTITVTIANDSSATVTDTANISEESEVLTATGIDITAVQGQSQDQTVATFTSQNATAGVGEFTATIDWGDGSSVDTGTITQPGGPGTPFFVDFTHTYSDAGTFTVHTQITDLGGIVTDVFSTATVTAPTSPLGPGGRSAASRGKGLLEANGAQPGSQQVQGATLTANLSASTPVQKTASVLSGQSGRADDHYWQLLGRGEQLTDSDSWAADQLALALEGKTV
jgi:hypothetical protein